MSEDFVVNDKRLFSKDGQVNGPSEAQAKPQPASPPKSQTAGDSSHLPANFASLVIGLATSAFIHMGEGPAGEGQENTTDLPAAQQAIDFLAVLQTKTQGNLEPEEESLLSTLLYDLRLKYVQTADRKS